MDKFHLQLYNHQKAYFKDLSHDKSVTSPNQVKFCFNLFLAHERKDIVTCRQTPADAKESKLG